MSDAEQAYAAAVDEIARVKAAGETRLDFDKPPFLALTTLPPEIAGLTALEWLDLDNTQVTSLDPIAGLTTLETLWLNNTQVTTLTPIAGLKALEGLHLINTQVTSLDPIAGLTALDTLWLQGSAVADLRPIRGLDRLGIGILQGLRFQNTPFAEATDDTRRLAAIEDDQQRIRETFAFLDTLPPLPEPLPWEVEAGNAGEGPPPEPVTVTGLIEAQDSAGWRYAPQVGSMVLYVLDMPLSDRQAQLARLAGQRAAALRGSLGARVNSGGLRQSVHDEITTFEHTLADDSVSLSLRSLELWTSLIALGSLLEENDAGKMQGRDPLDLLPNEGRAALRTFLAIASPLVRSFPEARELDDDHSGFQRRGLSDALILALLDKALAARFVDDHSAELARQVASLSQSSGVQSTKAQSVSAIGAKNLVLSAALAPLLGLGAIVTAGVSGDIGTDISNHYQLGERAIAFLEDARYSLEELLDNLPPDESAQLRSALDDLAREQERKNKSPSR